MIMELLKFRKTPCLILLGFLSTAFLTISLEAQIITTVAGGFVGEGGQATAASLAWPRYLAIDAAGNLYISDSSNNRIVKVDTSGVITTVAGTGISGLTGDGGPATAATLNYPSGIRFDTLGNLIIADQANNVIRKIDTSGIITTIAGTGTSGYSGDGGPATLAELDQPYGLAIGSDGSIYFSDAGKSVVRKIDPFGTITTVAGNGTATGSIDGDGGNPSDDLGDGGPATSASLNVPRSVLLDGSGNLYIADTANRRVRKVDTSGVITTVAGNGLGGFGGDGGPATAARISSPRGLAFDPSGNLLITNNRVRQVDSSGIITTIAGSVSGFNGDGNTALATDFLSLTDLVFDSAGNVLLADTGNARIRRIDLSGTVTTIAGGFVGDGNPATSAGLNLPQDVIVDTLGNIYIADSLNHRVRKVDTSGIITTIAGTGFSGFSGDGGLATSASLRFPFGVAVDTIGNVFIADTINAAIRKVDTSGVITTFIQDFSFFPFSMAFDASDDLYVADSSNCVVRKVDAFGIPTVVAGTGTCGFVGDGGPATAAQLFVPSGVVLDSGGNLYIADTSNNRIRKVDTLGIITTIAGNGTCGFSGDGGLATSASLCSPTDVGVDSTGNLYIADHDNSRIRRVDTSGTITTVAGNGEFGYSGDGGAATDARLGAPYALALDELGNIYVTDDFFFRVRKITPTSPIGPGPLAALFPRGLNFGSQLVSTTSAPKPVFLVNNGSAPLFIASIVTTTDFAQTNNCGFLPPKGFCVISVTFTPTAVGTRLGRVLIFDNAPGSLQSVFLVGRGR
jgi:sugar lactone lactonase YvrE